MTAQSRRGDAPAVAHRSRVRLRAELATVVLQHAVDARRVGAPGRARRRGSRSRRRRPAAGARRRSRRPRVCRTRPPRARRGRTTRCATAPRTRRRRGSSRRAVRGVAARRSARDARDRARPRGRGASAPRPHRRDRSGRRRRRAARSGRAPRPARRTARSAPFNGWMRPTKSSTGPPVSPTRRRAAARSPGANTVWSTPGVMISMRVRVGAVVAHELVVLLARRRDDEIGAAHDFGLDPRPERDRVTQSDLGLHPLERVERGDEREVELVLQPVADRARHPVVGVQHVVLAGAGEHLARGVGELADEIGEVAQRHRRERARRARAARGSRVRPRRTAAGRGARRG